jgi:hypothetical protein
LREIRTGGELILQNCFLYQPAQSRRKVDATKVWLNNLSNQIQVGKQKMDLLL